jgi:hypothetical protein
MDQPWHLQNNRGYRVAASLNSILTSLPALASLAAFPAKHYFGTYFRQLALPPPPPPRQAYGRVPKLVYLSSTQQVPRASRGRSGRRMYPTRYRFQRRRSNYTVRGRFRYGANRRAYSRRTYSSAGRRRYGATRRYRSRRF